MHYLNSSGLGEIEVIVGKSSTTKQNPSIAWLIKFTFTLKTEDTWQHENHVENEEKRTTPDLYHFCIT